MVFAGTVVFSFECINFVIPMLAARTELGLHEMRDQMWFIEVRCPRAERNAET